MLCAVASAAKVGLIKHCHLTRLHHFNLEDIKNDTLCIDLAVDSCFCWVFVVRNSHSSCKVAEIVLDPFP